MIKRVRKIILDDFDSSFDIEVVLASGKIKSFDFYMDGDIWEHIF